MTLKFARSVWKLNFGTARRSIGSAKTSITSTRLAIAGRNGLLLCAEHRLGAGFSVVGHTWHRRLLGFDETGVTFRYKDYRRDDPDRQQVMTLFTDEFIRRFLLHVLPRGFHRIRHYGLLAGSARMDNLVQARRLLEAPVVEQPESDLPDDARPPCPYCGGRMIVIESFARWCQPRAPPASTLPIRELVP